MKNKNIYAILFLVITGLFFAYLFAGFLKPDPYFHERMKPAYILVFLWGPRILIPSAYLFLIYFIFLAGKDTRKGISIVTGVLLLLFFLLYPFANGIFLKQGHDSQSLHQFHPYLQLAPPVPPTIASGNEPDTLIVFCLGGSTTEFRDSRGSGWTDRVEKMLSENNGDLPVKVYNLGRQWYSSLHTLVNFETNLRQLKPDMIIVMHAYNDLLHNADFSYLSNGPFRNDYGHFTGPVSDLLKPPQGLITALAEKFRGMWYHRPRTVIKTDQFPGLVPYRRNLEILLEIAAFDSTEIVLMTQPHLYSANMSDEIKEMCHMINIEAVGPEYQWDHSTAYLGMLAYNDAVRDIAKLRNIPLIDLEEEFPKSPDFFIDEVHYTDIGFDLMGKLVGNGLQDILEKGFMKQGDNGHPLR